MKTILFIANRHHFRVKANGSVDEKEGTFLIIIIKKSYLANAAMFPRV